MTESNSETDLLTNFAAELADLAAKLARCEMKLQNIEARLNELEASMCQWEEDKKEMLRFAEDLGIHIRVKRDDLNKLAGFADKWRRIVLLRLRPNQLNARAE